METRYQDFSNERMMDDYCWVLYRDDQSPSYKRKLYVLKAFLVDYSNLLNNKETVMICVCQMHDCSMLSLC